MFVLIISVIVGACFISYLSFCGGYRYGYRDGQESLLSRTLVIDGTAFRTGDLLNGVKRSREYEDCEI